MGVNENADGAVLLNYQKGYCSQTKGNWDDRIGSPVWGALSADSKAILSRAQSFLEALSFGRFNKEGTSINSSLLRIIYGFIGIPSGAY